MTITYNDPQTQTLRPLSVLRRSLLLGLLADAIISIFFALFVTLVYSPTDYGFVLTVIAGSVLMWFVPTGMAAITNGLLLYASMRRSTVRFGYALMVGILIWTIYGAVALGCISLLGVESGGIRTFQQWIEVGGILSIWGILGAWHSWRMTRYLQREVGKAKTAG